MGPQASNLTPKSQALYLKNSVHHVLGRLILDEIIWAIEDSVQQFFHVVDISPHKQVLRPEVEAVDRRIL